jgi:hypothetical protein
VNHSSDAGRREAEVARTVEHCPGLNAEAAGVSTGSLRRIAAAGRALAAF